MATNTRQQSKKGKAKAGSSIGPDDSASQVPFNRQSNSTNSSRESLVGSNQYENWTNAKPYLESFELELKAMDAGDITTSTYMPQSCQRIALCRSIPELNARRNKIRAIRYRVYGVERPSMQARYYPSQAIYDACKNEFIALDNCLEWSPTHLLAKNAEEGGDTIAMVMKYNPDHHNDLRVLLRALRIKATKDNKKDTSFLKDLRNMWPVVPDFPGTSANAYYSKFQWEVATCMYRDIVERFLMFTVMYQKTINKKSEEFDGIGSAMEEVREDPLPSAYKDVETVQYEEEVSTLPSHSELFTPGTAGAAQAGDYRLRDPPPLTREAVEQMEPSTSRRLSFGGNQYYPPDDSMSIMSPLMSRSQARDRQVGRVSGNLAAPMPFNTDATGRATSDI